MSLTSIDKSIRYDRGIRIWGEHGQSALEQARICLLNSSATGAEALKNMVLGGINSFTIVDSNIVDECDLGNNFLVTPGSIGASRAQVVTECLKELNDAVQGSFVEETPRNLIQNKPDFFQRFDIVIGTQLLESDEILLDSICRENGVLLVLVRAYGLVGILKNCVDEMQVVESKPESIMHDFRYGDPWPELQHAAESLQLDSMNPVDHGHVPYGMILAKAALEFRKKHGGALPSDKQGRTELKEIIRSWIRTVDNCPIPEENFEEALANVNKIWAPPKIPSEIRRILEDPKVDALTSHSDHFWIVIAAIKRFTEMEGEGHLPLCCTLPDMHSSTSQYLELQSIYKKKSENDVMIVKKHVDKLLNEIGLSADNIPIDVVKHISQHARVLRVVRSTPLKSKWTQLCPEDLKNLLQCEGKSSGVSLYLTMQAVDKFYEEYHRFPGTEDGNEEEDMARLKTILNRLDHCSSGLPISDDMIHEVVRCGGSELHTMSAVMGAMASQEVIKLLTGQCVPLDGTLIYDAMNSSTIII